MLGYSDSWEEHIIHLKTLLQSARLAGVRLSLEKCRFGFDELKILGDGLLRYGLSSLEEKVQSIVDLTIPSTMGKLHRLVGMFGYYGNFIKNFSKIAVLLNELKPQRRIKMRENSVISSPPGYSAKCPVTWNEESQQSFDELK